MRKWLTMLCLFAMLFTTLFSAVPALAAPESGGTSAVRMEIKTTPTPWKPFFQGVSTTVPGETFQASFWMKGTGKVTVRMQNAGGSTKYNEQVLEATDTWTKYELPEVAVTGTDGIAIWVFGTHISDILMDDFFLGKKGSEENLLVNPGFEDGQFRWGGGAWTYNPIFLWIDYENGRITQPDPGPGPGPDPDQKASAVKMVITGSPPWKVFSQAITGTVTGDTYQASFWMKGTGNVTVRLMDGNGANQYISSVFSGTDQWTQYKLAPVTIGTNGFSGLSLMVFGSHVSDLLMDDFFVGKAGDTVNLLTNPGFEEGQTGWGGGGWSHTPPYLSIDTVNGRVVEQLESSGFIDELDDSSQMFDYIANQAKYAVAFLGASPKDFRGDAKRLILRNSLPPGKEGHVIYHTDYNMESFFTEVFYRPDTEVRDITVSVSADNVNYSPVTLDKLDDGGSWKRILYSAYSMPIENARYIKVAFPPVLEGYNNQDIQISRIVVNLSTPYVTASGDETTGITLSTAAANAKIFYTLGSSSQEIEYTAPIPVVGNTIINAYAKITGKEKSITRRFSYVSQAAIKVDKYGQVKSAEFQGKVTSDQELLDDVAADAAYYGALNPPVRDRFGGLPGSGTAHGLEAKGFFNIQKLDDRYVMVDPDGNLFFSLGSTGIGNTGETFTRTDTREHMYEWLPAQTDEGGKYATAFRNNDGFSWYVANLIKKYNKPFSEPDYYSQSVERFKKWGFTSEGAWSRNPKMGENADNFPQYGFVYLPTDAKYYVSNADWKLLDVYRDDAADVISGSLKAYKVDTLKNDPWVIGWFFGNESKYQQFNTAVTAANAANSATKQAFMAMLEDKYQNIAALNASWKTDYESFTAMRNASNPIKTNEAYEDMLTFLEQYLEKYYSTVHEEFRKLNPNHMLVGDRYLIAPMNNTDTRRVISKVAGKYLDVLSYNYYTGEPDMERLKEMTELAGKPLMFTEFHYADPTHGLNGGIRVVANEDEKGKAYRNYVEKAAASGLVVGTHWFTYLDQAATGRYLQGFNGEAYGIGMIDVTDRPYKTMLGHVMDTNYRIYDLVLGNVEPYSYSTAPDKPSDQTVDIAKLQAPIMIDGVKDEAWPTGGTLELDARHQIVGLVNGKVSADMDLAWDNDNLYVYARINDDTPGLNPYPIEGNASRGIDWIWNGDALELFIGPEELEAKGQLREKDSQIIISAKGLYYWYNYNKLTQPDIDVAVKVDEEQQVYTIEAAIPLQSLGLDNIAPGRKMRFDVGFDNGDGEKRIAQYFWNGVEGNAQNRDKWGTATLVDTTTPVQNSLLGLTAPAAITGLANGTAKTAAALGLPDTVAAATSGGSISAVVEWDVEHASYDPARKDQQTFTVNGTVQLPANVANDNNIPLTVSVEVTVNAAAAGTPETPDTPDTPDTPETPEPPQGTGTGVPDSGFPDQSGLGTIAVKPVLDANRIANASIRAEDLKGKFAEVAPDAQGKKTVTIELKETVNADGYAVQLPKDYVAAAQGDTKIKVATPLGIVSLPRNLLPAKAAADVKDIQIRISKADITSGSVPEDAVTVEIGLLLDGKKEGWSNPEAPVGISIPYTAEKGKDTDFYTAFIRKADGTMSPVESSKYDSKKGMVVFTADKSGTYVAMYHKKTFEDAAMLDWAKHAIEVAASKGIMEGLQANQFAPKEAATRTEFIASLVKTLGITAEVTSNFADVDGSDANYSYIAIAKELGIASGVGNNKFHPDELISRQDAMVLAAKALQQANMMKVSADSSALSGFADKDQIAEYAGDSIAALLKEGFISGAGDVMAPQKTLTRAETAVIMYNIFQRKQ